MSLTPLEAAAKPAPRVGQLGRLVPLGWRGKLLKVVAQDRWFLDSGCRVAARMGWGGALGWGSREAGIPQPCWPDSTFAAPHLQKFLTQGKPKSGGRLPPLLWGKMLTAP